MDCLSQAECDALALGPRCGWPNRRIHAPKAEALLSGSDFGRGFGSVFHHQNSNPNHSRLGFFIAYSRQLPRVLAGSFGVLRTSPSPPLARFGAQFSLYRPFLSAGGTSCFGTKSAKVTLDPYIDQQVTSCRIDWFVLGIGRRANHRLPIQFVVTARRR